MFTSKIAQSQADFTQVMALLQESYFYAYESNYAASIQDTFFENIIADTIMLFYENTLVGTVALMHNSNENVFPSEFLLNYKRPNNLPKNIVEVGRLAKKSTLNFDKNIEYSILPALLWLTAARLKERDLKGYIGTVTPFLLRKFIQIGFQPQVLDNGIKSKNIEAFGSYINHDIKFFYCLTEVSYNALKRLGFDKFLENLPLNLVNKAA